MLCVSKIRGTGCYCEERWNNNSIKSAWVNEANLKYKKFKNPQGPTYSISLSEIMSVNYENGEKDTFEKINNPIKDSSNHMTSTKLIEKSADERNQELISIYNRNY